MARPTARKTGQLMIPTKPMWSDGDDDLRDDDDRDDGDDEADARGGH